MHNKKEVLKMKRFISLCLVLVLACTMSVTASAEYSESMDNTQPFYASGQSSINAKVYSSCTISIPETLDMADSNSWYVYFERFSIEDGYQIVVSVTNLNDNGAITLTHTDGTTANLYLLRRDTSPVTGDNRTLAVLKDTEIDYNNLPNMAAFYGNFFEATHPGNYTGIMQYEVSIEPYL